MADSTTHPTKKPSSAERLARLHAWLAQHREDIIEPALPIVDPHHHLWDRDGYTYLLPQLLADIDSGHNVIATVFLECSSMYRADGPAEMRVVGETEFVVGQSAMSASGQYGPRRAVNAIVGTADLMLGARVEAVLQAQIDAGNGRFKGIRFATAWEATGTVHSFYQTTPGMLADPRLRQGFAKLAPLGLSFDAWAYHPQLAEVADLADAFPDTTIILDHVGGPIGEGSYAQTRGDAFALWRTGIEALARRENVYAKLGGLGMRLWGFGYNKRERPPSSETLAQDWRPFVETCIAAFGAGRCMFESNFPVDKVSCSYPVLWNAFKRLAAGASADEKQALFGGTASRVYRLG